MKRYYSSYYCSIAYLLLVLLESSWLECLRYVESSDITQVRSVQIETRTGTVRTDLN